MAITNSIIAVLLLFLLFDNYAECIDAVAPNSNDDASSIPMIASGKRMHNIMRFGKRPDGGEKLIQFEKRGNTKVPQHSFLFFGKRENEQSALPDLILRYLQDGANISQDISDKRNVNNHNMMRFGKRSPDGSSNLFDNGAQDYEDYDGYLPNGGTMDEDKRAGHSMMYFGKRGGHNMMYFGKRAAGHNILSFGKRPAGHSILSFGKRPAGHSILSFGKRPAGHSILSFGKRDDEEEDMLEEEKRGGGHAMFHFGKRDEEDDAYPYDIKRASHSMIHFGKRDFANEPVPFYWNPAASEREAQQNIYRYGKKTGKNNHAMIHFGKRDPEKKSHAMIHFGKRSVDEENNNAVSTTNQSQNTPTNAVTRMKRDLETVGNAEPLVTLIRYGSNDDEDVGPEEDVEDAIRASQSTMYYPGGMINPLPYEIDPLLSISPDYRPLLKKEASKNMFMRFG